MVQTGAKSNESVYTNKVAEHFVFTHKFNDLERGKGGKRVMSSCYQDKLGNNWQIKLYPFGRKCEFCGNSVCKKHSTHVSIYLVAANCTDIVELDWWKTIRCRMSLLVPKKETQSQIIRTKEIDKRKFDCNHLDWGWSEFVPLEYAVSCMAFNFIFSVYLLLLYVADSKHFISHSCSIYSASICS